MEQYLYLSPFDYYYIQMYSNNTCGTLPKSFAFLEYYIQISNDR